MSKRGNKVSVIVPQTENSCEYFAFVGYGPLQNLSNFVRFGVDAVIEHYPAEVIYALSKKKTLGGFPF